MILEARDTRADHSLATTQEQQDLLVLLEKHAAWLKQQPEWGRIQQWPRVTRKEVHRKVLKQLFRSQ